MSRELKAGKTSDTMFRAQSKMNRQGPVFRNY